MLEQARTNQISPVALLPARPARLAGLVLALLLLLAGLTAFWLWTSRAPGEGSPETTFARDMGAHHAQAVEMALTIRDRSADTGLRQLALDIILTQQAQIGQMEGWLAVWDQPLSGPQPPMDGQGEMMGMATQEQVNQLATRPVPAAELSFLQLMIRHHQGGIALAQEALKRTSRPEVVRLARAIVQGQQSEITYMEALLKQRGAPAPTPLEPMQMDSGGH